jgi:hypothetical protein
MILSKACAYDKATIGAYVAQQQAGCRIAAVSNA